MARLKTIEWINNTARIVDQTKLPTELLYKDIATIEEMYNAIKTLAIRGAPAIGVAAAFGLYLGVKDFSESGVREEFDTRLKEKADYLNTARPTAVNLKWALDRMISYTASLGTSLSVCELKDQLLSEAKRILEEDKQACIAIGENGFKILKDYNTILTHCNAGGLATVEYGTALSPVYIGKEKDKIFHVFVDETRPLLQGARITAFELTEASIPITLICDNMAASVMAQGKIDAVIVGADRIAANGDTANKIGTYSVALVAKAHAVPFYVAAPLSTFDVSITTGKEIPIEERSPDEIINGFGKQTGPEGVPVYNPAFDVTPHELVTAIITEKGVLFPPFKGAISEVVRMK